MIRHSGVFVVADYESGLYFFKLSPQFLRRVGMCVVMGVNFLKVLLSRYDSSL